MAFTKTYSAPAKINRMLKIIARRDDGYHELQTVFQFLTLSDELTVTIEPEKNNGNFTLLSSMTDVKNEDNLIQQAAQLLARQSPSHPQTEIQLIKAIPVGGGLGGGSSNAASTLVALNTLWQMGLSKDELMQLGASLGADVPIFIYGHAAWAEGLGEQIQPIELDEPWYVLLVPQTHVSTAKIFSHPALTRDSEVSRIRTSLNLQDKLHGENDCEVLVRQLYPEIDQLFQQSALFGQAFLTGTGGCVLLGFDNEEKARKIATRFPAELHCMVTQGVNHSNLYA